MDILKKRVLNHQVYSALAAKGYQVGDIGGDKIFTDDEIKASFIESISKQDTFQPILDKIIDLVETDRIIPVYVKFGTLEKIRNFFFHNKRKFAESKNVMAFCDFNTQKIIMLVENIKNVKYWNKQEALSLVLLHELQHLCSYLFSGKFMNLHKKTYSLYYKRFFDSYFGAEISEKEAFDFAVFLHKEWEIIEDSSTTFKQLFDRYYDKLEYILKNKNIKNYKDKIHMLLNIIYLYITKPSEYHMSIAYKEPEPTELFHALRNSYKALKILNTGSLYIQEVMYCSEVICIESEYNTQKRHFVLINQIK